MSKLIGTILPPFKSMIEQYFDILEQFQKEFGTKNKKITVLTRLGTSMRYMDYNIQMEYRQVMPGKYQRNVVAVLQVKK